MIFPAISTQSGGINIIASGLGITFSKDADYNCDFYIDNVIWPEDLLTQEIFRIITVAKALDVEYFAVGTGTTKPINLATYRNKKIFINFWVRTTSKKENREIKYCLYMEE